MGLSPSLLPIPNPFTLLSLRLQRLVLSTALDCSDHVYIPRVTDCPLLLICFDLMVVSFLV